MKALILAAGYATRLYPLTREYPKSLLEIKGKPIIEHILDKLAEIKKIDEIIIVTNSKFISRFKAWAKTIKTKKPLRLLDDLTKSNKDRLGAIGDMHFVVKKMRPKDDLLVIGGDNIFDADLNVFISASAVGKLQPLVGAFDIRDRAEAKKYGVLKLDKKNRIIDFQEKPKRPKSALVAMCLYYFPKETLAFIGEYLKTKRGLNDATGFYIDWLRKKTPVYGVVFRGRWYDIGDYKFYNEAKAAFR